MEAAALLAEALQLALDQHLQRKKKPRLLTIKKASSDRVLQACILYVGGTFSAEAPDHGRHESALSCCSSLDNALIAMKARTTAVHSIRYSAGSHP